MQFSSSMMEERYFFNTPAIIKYHNKSDDAGLHLFIFSDPLCEEKFTIEVDILHTLKQMFMTYGMTGIAPMFAFAFLGLAIQSYTYRKGDIMRLSDIVLKLNFALLPISILCSILFHYSIIDLSYTPSILSYSFLMIPKPWPTIDVLILMNLLGISSLLVYTILCQFILDMIQLIIKIIYEREQQILSIKIHFSFTNIINTLKRILE